MSSGWSRVLCLLDYKFHAICDYHLQSIMFFYFCSQKSARMFNRFLGSLVQQQTNTIAAECATRCVNGYCNALANALAHACSCAFSVNAPYRAQVIQILHDGFDSRLEPIALLIKTRWLLTRRTLVHLAVSFNLLNFCSNYLLYRGWRLVPAAS